MSIGLLLCRRDEVRRHHHHALTMALYLLWRCTYYGAVLTMALYLLWRCTYYGAVLTRYADNIVKCFAAALAILSGTLISMPLFHFHPSRLFAVGGLCTVSATVLYSWAPTTWPEGWTRAGRQQQRRRATASLELEALDDQEWHTACACACARARACSMCI